MSTGRKILKLPVIDCQYLERNLDAYLEDEASSAQVALIDAHLSRCSECRELVQDVAEIMQTAASLAWVPLPDGVSGRLRERLRRETGIAFGESAQELVLVK